MIPQVTVASSETGFGHGAILDDLSDENLIRQLQLAATEKTGGVIAAAASSATFNSVSYVNAESCHQPTSSMFRDRTNQHSPEKAPLTQN